MALARCPSQGYFEYGALYADTGYIDDRDVLTSTNARGNAITQINTMLANTRMQGGPCIVQDVRTIILTRDVENIRQHNYTYQVVLLRPMRDLINQIKESIHDLTHRVHMRNNARHTQGGY